MVCVENAALHPSVSAPAVGLGVAYLISIGLLGPLLGSTADSSTAYDDHFASNSNVLVDLAASFLLLVAAACLVWTVVVAREATTRRDQTARLDELVGAASLISSSAIVVSAGLLATVPLTTSIGNLTDDPGIDVSVQAGIAQAGTVVLLVAMIAVGVTSVLVAHLGYRCGAVSRWVVVAAWLTAGALLLGVSIALLFPFGGWAIALGLAWKDPRHTTPPERLTSAV